MITSLRSKTQIACLAFCSALLAVSHASAAPALSKQDSPNAQEQGLIKTLVSDAPPQEKASACKKLVTCGTEKAVPALATLLSDEKLAAWARIALEAIPGPAADHALRSAAEKLQGKLLVGVINSMGV